MAKTETPTPTEPAPPAPEGDEEEDGEQAFAGTISSDAPIVAPDGHVNLSQEDIDSRDAVAG